MTDYEDDLDDFDYDFTWDHRVLKTTHEFEGTLVEEYTIVECHYKDGKPHGCSDPFLTGDTIEELNETLENMKIALTKPVLFLEDIKIVTDLDILVGRDYDDDDGA
jgi:hypothetical protein